MTQPAYDPFAVYDPSILVASTPIEIEVPASVVWSILTDLRYGQWNPFCVYAESTLEMGAPVVMSLVNYTEPGTLFPNVEYVCAFEPERLLSWELLETPDWPYSARPEPARRYGLHPTPLAVWARRHKTEILIGG